MKTKLKLICLIALVSGATKANAQVSNIKETARKDKITYTPTSRKSYSHSSNSDYEYNLAEEIVNGIFTGLVKGFAFVTIEAQKAALDHTDEIPNLTSLEFKLDYGTNLSELTFNPSIRGTWGILATDLQYSLLDDHTGSLQSIDWQVLVLRVPLKYIKLNYGIGFTSLLDPKTTYFESSTGFELNLKENKLNICGNYRWTARKKEERYRQEVKLNLDYELYSKGNFHVSPLLGVTYQEYFSQHHYTLFNIGVKFRFY